MEERKQTLLLGSDAEGIAQAARLLRESELVGIPTETVYGLAADALNGTAAARIFAAKGRPQDNPLIVHIASLSEWEPLVRELPAQAVRLAEAYWPGPLTMILPRSGRVPEAVSAGLPTVAVRMPSHPVARAIIEAAGRPLAAPSANRSGSPSPTTAAHVLADMEGRIAAVVDGGPCSVGVESTVVDLTPTLQGGPVRLLRPGGITVPQLEAAAGTVVIDPAVTDRLAEGAVASSPGMKYKHYAPQAQVIIVRGDPEHYAAYVNRRAQEEPDRHVAALCFEEDRPRLQVPCVMYGRRDDPSSQARGLFDALRRLDADGIDVAYAACPGQGGVGLAVYNRLLRAAAFTIVDA